MTTAPRDPFLSLLLWLDDHPEGKPNEFVALPEEMRRNYEGQALKLVKRAGHWNKRHHFESLRSNPLYCKHCMYRADERLKHMAEGEDV